MNKYISVATSLILTVLVFSCTPSLKVNTDFDRSTNFSQYKTFSLYRTDSMSNAISSLNQERILNAVIGEMTKKGFRQTNADPDLLVNTIAILKDKIALSSNTDYYGYGGVYRPYYWGTGLGVSSTTNYNIQNYKDGSLIIDVVDAKTKRLIWQGVGNNEIDKPLKDPDTAIPQAITKILAAFPPGTASKK